LEKFSPATATCVFRIDILGADRVLNGLAEIFILHQHGVDIKNGGVFLADLFYRIIMQLPELGDGFFAGLL
jgi:hypothetical protein